MSKRGRSIDGPVAFVEALTARSARSTKRRRRRRRRHVQSPLLRTGKDTLKAAGSAAEHLSKKVSGGSKRRRAALRKAGKRLERLSSSANHVGTLLGIAAAGAELVSAIRDHKGDGHAETVARAATNGAHRAHEEEEVLEDAR